MKMKQVIAVLGFLLLVVAFAPSAADAQQSYRDTPEYRRLNAGYGYQSYGSYGYGQPPGRRGQPNGGWIGGPHNTYPIDRSAAPCLPDGSFGPNNRFQTPYNGPYGFPGQHPCQFDWASQNRMKEANWYGRINVGLNLIDLGVDIWTLKRVGKAVKLGEENKQIGLQILASQEELLARGRPDVNIQQQQQQSLTIRDIDPTPSRPRHRPSAPAPKERWTYWNCEDVTIKIVDNRTRQEVILKPGAGATRSWDPNHVSMYGPNNMELTYEIRDNNQVAVLAAN